MVISVVLLIWIVTRHATFLKRRSVTTRRATTKFKLLTVPSSLRSQPDRGKRKAKPSWHRSLKLLLFPTSSLHILPTQDVRLAHMERLYHLWRGGKGDFDHSHVPGMVSTSTQKPESVVIVVDAWKRIFSVWTTYDTLNLEIKIPQIDVTYLIWRRARAVFSCVVEPTPTQSKRPIAETGCITVSQFELEASARNRHQARENTSAGSQARENVVTSFLLLVEQMARIF